MIKIKKIYCITILVILELIALVAQAKTTTKPNKVKMNNFIKDVYNLDSISDLSKLGVKIMHKEKEPSSVISSAVRGPSAIHAGPIHGRAGPIQASAPSSFLSSEVKDATPGKCDPKPECISNPLTLNLNANELAFPPCINIHRCDGCCPINEKCVAIKYDEIKMQKVGIITFEGDNQRYYEEKLVTVTNHTECQCQCQWENDEDCKKVNKNFVKSFYDCSCECPEELSCDAFHEFDRESCSCKCRKDKFLRLEQTCRLKGFNWNDNDCRCESKLSMSHREIQIQKNLN